MPEMTFADAMVDAIAARMHRDPMMTLIGSAFLLGPYSDHPVLNEVREKYANRIIDEPPIAESAVAAMAIGAAMGGARPLAHFGLATFALEAWSQIVSEAGCAYHQSGGQVTVPVTMTMMHGILPIETSQSNISPYAALANSPGLEIVLASTPADIKGLMATALASDNPTVVMNHPFLMGSKGEVPAGDYAIPFGKADIKRKGSDVTVVATSHKVLVALEAARQLAERGIEAEVIDPRTIVPLDRDAILESVRRTGRLVVVDESHLTCGFGAEVLAFTVERALRGLKAAPIRISPPDIPIPRGSIAQRPFQITPDKVVAGVESLFAKGA